MDKIATSEWDRAGALLEQVQNVTIHANYGKTLYCVIASTKNTATHMISSWPKATNESLPAAIIEACEKALAKESPAPEGLDGN